MVEGRAVEQTLNITGDAVCGHDESRVDRMNIQSDLGENSLLESQPAEMQR